MTSSTPLSRNPLFYLGLTVVIVVVITAQVGALYQLQNLFGTVPAQEPISVNTLLNYGNGTSRWRNQTEVPSDWSFYKLTTTIAQTESSPTTSVSGQHYITGLDGVRSSGPYDYWTLWVFCQKDTAWATSPVGADLIKMKSGDTFAWYYQTPPSTNPATWNPPVQGALRVSRCSS